MRPSDPNQPPATPSDERLRALIARDEAAWSGDKPKFAPPVELSPTGVPVGTMVLEDRS